MSASDAVDGSSTRHASAMDVGAVEALRSEERHMQAITTVSIAKSNFQAHGVDVRRTMDDIF